MRHSYGQKRRGLTLPEVLTSLVVLMVIGGTVVSIYQTSLRQWRTGTVENLASQNASWTVQRMAAELHQGISVEPGDVPFDSTYVTIQLPNRIFDAGRGAHFNEVRAGVDGLPELVTGNYAVYYRGEQDQDPSATGDCLWRRLVANDRATILKVDKVADHIVDNPPDDTGNPKAMFHYYPDMDHRASVEVTVTVEERMGSKVALCTMNSELALRNY